MCLRAARSLQSLPAWPKNTILGVIRETDLVPNYRPGGSLLLFLLSLLFSFLILFSFSQGIIQQASLDLGPVSVELLACPDLGRLSDSSSAVNVEQRSAALLLRPLRALLILRPRREEGPVLRRVSD